MTDNDDKDVLAAEFVLGTLDGEERTQARGLIDTDPGFAANVRKWERRLGELNVLVAPVEPPPAILDRIKARIAGVEPPPVEAAAAPIAAPSPDAPPDSKIEPTPAAPSPPEPVVADRGGDVIQLTRRVRRWRGYSTAITALAAAFAGLVVAREFRPDLMPEPLRPKVEVVERLVEVIKEIPSPKPAQYVAVLQKDAASPAFLLTFDLERRTLTVRTVGAERLAGKSYELWLVSDKFASPRSLGLVGAEEFTERAQLASYDAVTINNATYAVSLEPEGGSPTGSPTGPVLFTGKLLQATPPGLTSPSP